MPCFTEPNMTPVMLQKRQSAVERLEAAIALEGGAVSVVVGPTGAVAFRGWTDRQGVSDVCAYRAMAAKNSPALRRAVMRAEARAGVKVNVRAVAQGVHSHDGGATWHPGH